MLKTCLRTNYIIQTKSNFLQLVCNILFEIAYNIPVLYESHNIIQFTMIIYYSLIKFDYIPYRNLQCKLINNCYLPRKLTPRF